METLKDKEATAYHEAGHVMAFILSGIRFREVTIKPKKGSYSGAVKYKTHIRHELANIDFLYPGFFYKWFRWDIILVAGSMAEAIYGNSDFESGGHPDIVLLFRTFSNLSKDMGKKYLDFLIAYTNEALINNWTKIEAIAKALLEKETLCYDDVTNIVYK
ncbi:MAG: hypothetical protein WCS03_08120 [Bacteroidota bacterium]